MSYTPQYVIQRSTTAKDRAFKKGNIVVGAEETNYGPTETTGYYTGPNPPDGGFVLITTQPGEPPRHKTFEDTGSLLLYYTENYNSVSSFNSLLGDIAENDEMVLVSSDPLEVEYTEIDVPQKARNLTQNFTAQGKLHRIKGRKSDNKTQHGFEWVCMRSDTVHYAAIYPGTIISEINSDGSLTTKLSSTTAPTVGTISMTAGKVYTCTKPTHFLRQAYGEAVFPLSYAGKLFGFYYSRYNPQTVYIYALEDNTNVKFWKGKINGTLIQENTLSEGELWTFNGSYAGDYYHIQADKPIAATAAGAGDKSILPQASTNYSYRRYNEQERCVDGTAPSYVGTYVIKDDNSPCWAISIADGNGGDNEGSMPLDYLTDTYAFGAGALRSYFIVSPYTNTITVSYYNAGSWTQYASHVENGTLTSPSVHSEGSQNGSYDLVSGLGTVPWKFEGTNPFYIVINDGSADEEALMGWNRDERIISISF